MGVIWTPYQRIPLILIVLGTLSRMALWISPSRKGGGLNLAVGTKILDSEFGTEDPVINSGAIGKDGGLGTIPKGRSITHNIFDNQRAIFLSFDIETAGEIAGIVQISAEIVRLKIDSAKKKVGFDHAGNILREEDTFNRYVNPKVCSEYWDQHSISVHGILPLPDDERIINAGNMRTVLP
jgi:hypothetical protein